jgi:hypothetical protein
MCNKTVFNVSHKASDAPMWSDLLKVRDLYLHGGGLR